MTCGHPLMLDHCGHVTVQNLDIETRYGGLLADRTANQSTNSERAFSHA